MAKFDARFERLEGHTTPTIKVIPPDERFFQAGADLPEYGVDDWRQDWKEKRQAIAAARKRGEQLIVVLPRPDPSWHLTDEQIFEVTGGKE